MGSGTQMEYCVPVDQRAHRKFVQISGIFEAQIDTPPLTVVHPLQGIQQLFGPVSGQSCLLLISDHGENAGPDDLRPKFLKQIGIGEDIKTDDPITQTDDNTYCIIFKQG